MAIFNSYLKLPEGNHNEQHMAELDTQQKIVNFLAGEHR